MEHGTQFPLPFSFLLKEILEVSKALVQAVGMWGVLDRRAWTLEIEELGPDGGKVAASSDECLTYRSSVHAFEL